MVLGVGSGGDDDRAGGAVEVRFERKPLDEPQAGARRAEAVDGARDHGPPGLAGGPARHLGHGGQQGPEGHQHGERAGRGAEPAVDGAQGPRREEAVEVGADRQADGLPDERAADEHADHDRQGSHRLVGLGRPHDVGQEAGREDEADSESHPRQPACHQPEAPAADDRRDSSDEHDEIEGVHGRGPRQVPSRRAWVRKPV